MIRDIAHIPLATRSKIRSAEDFRSLLLEYYRPYRTKWYRIHDNVRSRSIIAVHGVSERISRAIDNGVNKKAKLIDIVSA